MQVAVTFCNQHSTPRLAVCAVDLETGARGFLRVPDEFDRGAAGLTEIDGDLAAGCQPGGIVRYDRALQPAAMLPTPGARNLHSVLFRPDERSLYVTSAHNDTLFRYRLDDAGMRVVATDEIYCADPERRMQDRYHLNSVTEWRGDLYVTMFGPADGPTHKHRRNGRLVRVRDRATIAEGLYHPHTSFVHRDALFVVESQAHVVRRVDGGEPATWTIPNGYPRGLVSDGERLWVGVSALRRESSSLGTPNVLHSAAPRDFCTRLVELDLDSGPTGREVDLTLLAAEIFDIRPLPEGTAFLPDATGGLAERVEALEDSFRTQRAQRRELETRLERTPVHRARTAAARLRRRFLPG